MILYFQPIPTMAAFDPKIQLANIISPEANSSAAKESPAAPNLYNPVISPPSSSTNKTVDEEAAHLAASVAQSAFAWLGGAPSTARPKYQFGSSTVLTSSDEFSQMMRDFNSVQQDIIKVLELISSYMRGDQQQAKDVIDFLRKILERVSSAEFQQEKHATAMSNIDRNLRSYIYTLENEQKRLQNRIEVLGKQLHPLKELRETEQKIIDGMGFRLPNIARKIWTGARHPMSMTLWEFMVQQLNLAGSYLQLQRSREPMKYAIQQLDRNQHRVDREAAIARRVFYNSLWNRQSMILVHKRHSTKEEIDFFGYFATLLEELMRCGYITYCKVMHMTVEMLYTVNCGNKIGGTSTGRNLRMVPSLRDRLLYITLKALIPELEQIPEDGPLLWREKHFNYLGGMSTRRYDNLCRYMEDVSRRNCRCPTHDQDPIRVTSGTPQPPVPTFEVIEKHAKKLAEEGEDHTSNEGQLDQYLKQTCEIWVVYTAYKLWTPVTNIFCEDVIYDCGMNVYAFSPAEREYLVEEVRNNNPHLTPMQQVSALDHLHYFKWKYCPCTYSVYRRMVAGPTEFDNRYPRLSLYAIYLNDKEEEDIETIRRTETPKLHECDTADEDENENAMDGNRNSNTRPPTAAVSVTTAQKENTELVKKFGAVTLNDSNPKRKVTYLEDGELRVSLPRTEVKARPYRNSKPCQHTKAKKSMQETLHCFVCKRPGHSEKDCWKAQVKSKPNVGIPANSSALSPNHPSEIEDSGEAMAAAEATATEDPKDDHWTTQLTKRHKRILQKKEKTQRTKAEKAERAAKLDWDKMHWVPYSANEL